MLSLAVATSWAFIVFCVSSFVNVTFSVHYSPVEVDSSASLFRRARLLLSTKMACVSQDTQTADILSLTPATRSNIIEPMRAWGRLYSTYLHLEPVDLEEKSYKLGRATSCDIVITEDKVPIHRIVAISKVHFEITRDDSLVCIKDLSKNGTFLNGNLIGKGKVNILQNDDEIAIGYKGLKVYIFKAVADLEDNSYLPMRLRKKYQISRLLGRGACGEVKLVFEKQSLKMYAVKKIIKSLSLTAKNKLNNPLKISREIQIMKSLKHPCVISLLDIEETEESVFIILEYMEGGELNELVKTTRPLTEPQAKKLFYQMALAIRYLHSRGIIHRDIKPENILLTESTPDTLIKISDFGLSRFLDEESDYQRTMCGTPQYAAPEIMNRQVYGFPADVWSLGVVLYYMLVHTLPFSGSRNIANELKYIYDRPCWQSISDKARDLVSGMLTVDPADRIRVDDILKHSWLTDDDDMITNVNNSLYGILETCLPCDSPDFLSECATDSNDSPPAKRPRSD